MDKNKLSFSSPWVLYVKKLSTFFAEDPDISIEYDADNTPNVVTIRVDNQDKYYALTELIDTEVRFGNFTLKIDIRPANLKYTDKIALFSMLLKGNPIVESIESIRPDGRFNAFNYISFRNEVVKYWSDNLGNPHGNSFTLFEILADEIFHDQPGVLFTTAEE